ncbi:uncharacterized protein ATNIH1004_001847 [Aspergillus tanneri]|nr:uncharacterized protein ATNIH1004_001847 [Aspergillus tanneri]KAA8652938.1 hypothetical protein ATNIH1004_001847 [Aspergillus tanneri]
MFKHVQETYQGAVTLSFDPYLFQAAGFYGTIEIAKTNEQFTSAFIYFILNGPLATFGFAEIRGVVGGFGYNNSLQFPSVTNVLDFPLITPPAATKPDEALKALMDGTWFFSKKDSFWLAAGLTVLAFEILNMQAALVVEWDPKVKIGLFAVATADMPAKADKKFAHVQLGMTAVLDLETGTLKIEGQLTPASYVLDPSCHLTGGFGFYTWFANDKSTSAGDFVFTIGGYHRSYQVPPYYPKPPRLAISWAYDTSISIRGEAYFAITPKVCMGGGRLDASLTLGALYAFFNAYADFLIKYNPFFFIADGGVSVGVRFTLDLWICTVHISIELSATLYIQGPPISGTVHVNFWVFGFDINFGSRDEHQNDPISLQAFYDQALQSDLPRNKGESKPPPPFIFTCNQGLIPSSETNAKTSPNDADEVWNVRGAVFQFTVGCKFAIRNAIVVTGQLGTTEEDQKVQIPKDDKDMLELYAKPMQLKKSLMSTLTVTIRPIQERKELTASDEPVGVPKWEKATLIFKAVPVALWGYYDENEDPNNPNVRDPNQIGPLLRSDKHSVSQAMGITVSSPLPELSVYDKIKAFQYKTFFINEAGGPYPFPRVPTVETLWDPLPEDRTSKAWENARRKWNGDPGLGKGAAETFVDLWAKLSFAQWNLTEAGAIRGTKPTSLVDNEDTFATLFLEAPRMGIPVAA